MASLEMERKVWLFEGVGVGSVGDGECKSVSLDRFVGG